MNKTECPAIMRMITARKVLDALVDECVPDELELSDPLWAWDGHTGSSIRPNIDVVDAMIKATRKDFRSAARINGRIGPYKTIARICKERAIEAAVLLCEIAQRFHILEQLDWTGDGRND